VWEKERVEGNFDGLVDARLDQSPARSYSTAACWTPARNSAAGKHTR
jgi:hypothetical protein